MKHTLLFFFYVFLIGCGTPKKKENNIIGDPKPVNTETSKSEIPEGAITADFNGDKSPFYGFVQKVDLQRGITTVGFERKQYPVIEIPKSYGATLDTLKMKGMDRDVLLATVKLKDTNFNKYFLYKLQNNQWKSVVNGFAIHKANRPDTLQPIVVDPKDSTKVIRYYSVFDMDKNSETGYKWKLLQETIPIEN